MNTCIVVESSVIIILPGRLHAWLVSRATGRTRAGLFGRGGAGLTGRLSAGLARGS